MPTQWTLTPTPQPPPDVAPVHLHALACALVESPGSDHTAQTKPFAAALSPSPASSPLAPASSAAARAPDRVLVVGWLDDAGEPDLAARLGSPVRLVSRPLRLAPAARRAVPYAELAAAPPAVKARVEFATPAYVNRGGRQFPLPDPELLLGGLARRWAAFSPCPLPVRAVDEAMGSVHLARHDIATRTAGTGRHRRTGFTGAAVFGLPSSASPEARRAFAALWSFGEFAGVGAQTTHGLGHIRVRLGRGLARPGAGPSPGESPSEEKTD
ncbi:CRISPR system precrRNA processing endoribonuclease RAMP protein Cas6 [Nocardiopsis potens]|uniref:CRISPR system precrRNA processing endoribonuclease RAMP protein Cas6 n=1 Tax=Nocardiopsis potens TaxID=1246458 RepID=UPI0009D91C92|nr:CRISPR system precrRNA processing endoribonuclease RAMP protein Cas6 [Nocardiopsis potens]